MKLNIKFDNLWLFVILALAFINKSCIDKYWPDNDLKFDKIMVVDGMITNKPGPYSVYLSLSSSVTDPEFIPLSNYTLIILDDHGNHESLSYKGNGLYQSSVNGIQGEIGRRYKLVIHAHDEKVYESNYELLREPTEIDTVYAELEFHTDSDYEYNLAGYQFYVDTKKAEIDTNYILWRMEYTYQYEANYLARYVFDNYEMSTLSPRDSLLTCWKTGKRNEIVTATTEILTEPVLIRIPLNYVTTETKELSIRYSMLVKQFTLNLDAYNFWSQLSEYTDYTPWIYFNQPYSVKGNIKSLDDEHEIVLGYFMAAGLDEKRIFVDKPLGVDWNYNTTCGFYTDDLTRRLHLMRNSWPVYLTKYFNGFNVVTALPVEQYCVDCRKSGGVLEPPQFWIE